MAFKDSEETKSKELIDNFPKNETKGNAKKENSINYFEDISEEKDSNSTVKLTLNEDSEVNILSEKDSESSQIKNSLLFNRNSDEEKDSFFSKKTETLKIVLLGGEKVGKTSIISKLESNILQSETETTKEAVKTTKTIDLKNKNKSIIFEIWDTPSKEKYETSKKDFFENAQVIMLVYDINNKNSFDEIKNYWILEAKKYLKEKPSK